MPLLTPHVPNGLIELMKDLAKEVLRDKPENIYEFAAVHFEKLIQQRDGSMDKGYEQFVAYDAHFEGQQRFAVPANCGYTCQRPAKPTLAARKSKSDVLASFKAMESINEEDVPAESLYTDEKYQKAIYVIQRYYRRWADKKKEITPSTGLTATTAAIIIQRTMRKLFANKIKLKGPTERDTPKHDGVVPDDVDNESEAASYTSASTVQMLADGQEGKENRSPGRDEVSDGFAGDDGSEEVKEQPHDEPLVAEEENSEATPTEKDKKSIADENGNTESLPEEEEPLMHHATATLDDTSTAHIGKLSTIGSNDQQNSLHTNTVEIDSNSSDSTHIQNSVPDIVPAGDYPLNYPKSQGATPDTLPAASPQPEIEESFTVRLHDNTYAENTTQPYQVRKYVPVTRESLRIYDAFYQDRDDPDFSDSLNESTMERDSLENEDLDVDSLESNENVTQNVKKEVKQDDGSLYEDGDDVQPDKEEDEKDVQRSIELERVPSYLYGIHPPRTPVVERKNSRNKSSDSRKIRGAKDSVSSIEDRSPADKSEDVSFESKESTSDESSVTQIENLLEHNDEHIDSDDDHLKDHKETSDITSQSQKPSSATKTETDSNKDEVRTTGDESETEGHRQKRSLNEGKGQQFSEPEKPSEISETTGTPSIKSEDQLNKTDVQDNQQKKPIAEPKHVSKAGDGVVPTSSSHHLESYDTEESNTLLIESLFPHDSSPLGYFATLYSDHNLSPPTSASSEEYDPEVKAHIREIQGLNYLYPGLEIKDIISEFHSKDVQPHAKDQVHDANNNLEAFERNSDEDSSSESQEELTDKDKTSDKKLESKDENSNGRGVKLEDAGLDKALKVEKFDDQGTSSVKDEIKEIVSTHSPKEESSEIEELVPPPSFGAVTETSSAIEHVKSLEDAVKSSRSKNTGEDDTSGLETPLASASVDTTIGEVPRNVQDIESSKEIIETPRSKDTVEDGNLKEEPAAAPKILDMTAEQAPKDLVEHKSSEEPITLGKGQESTEANTKPNIQEKVEDHNSSEHIPKSLEDQESVIDDAIGRTPSLAPKALAEASEQTTKSLEDEGSLKDDATTTVPSLASKAPDESSEQTAKSLEVEGSLKDNVVGTAPSLPPKALDESSEQTTKSLEDEGSLKDDTTATVTSHVLRALDQSSEDKNRLSKSEAIGEHEIKPSVPGDEKERKVEVPKEVPETVEGHKSFKEVPGGEGNVTDDKKPFPSVTPLPQNVSITEITKHVEDPEPLDKDDKVPQSSEDVKKSLQLQSDEVTALEENSSKHESIAIRSDSKQSVSAPYPTADQTINLEPDPQGTEEVKEPKILKESSTSAVKAEMEGDSNLEHDDYFGNPIDKGEPSASTAIKIIKIEGLDRSRSISRLDSGEKLPKVEEETNETEDVVKSNLEQISVKLANLKDSEQKLEKESNERPEQELQSDISLTDIPESSTNRIAGGAQSKKAEEDKEHNAAQEHTDVPEGLLSSTVSNVIEATSLTDALKSHKKNVEEHAHDLEKSSLTTALKSYKNSAEDLAKVAEESSLKDALKTYKDYVEEHAHDVEESSLTVALKSFKNSAEDLTKVAEVQRRSDANNESLDKELNEGKAKGDDDKLESERVIDNSNEEAAQKDAISRDVALKSHDDSSSVKVENKNTSDVLITVPQVNEKEINNKETHPSLEDANKQLRDEDSSVKKPETINYSDSKNTDVNLSKELEMTAKDTKLEEQDLGEELASRPDTLSVDGSTSKEKLEDSKNTPSPEIDHSNELKDLQESLKELATTIDSENLRTSVKEKDADLKTLKSETETNLQPSESSSAYEPVQTSKLGENPVSKGTEQPLEQPIIDRSVLEAQIVDVIPKPAQISGKEPVSDHDHIKEGEANTKPKPKPLNDVTETKPDLETVANVDRESFELQEDVPGKTTVRMPASERNTKPDSVEFDKTEVKSLGPNELEQSSDAIEVKEDVDHTQAEQLKAPTLETSADPDEPKDTDLGMIKSALEAKAVGVNQKPDLDASEAERLQEIGTLEEDSPSVETAVLADQIPVKEDEIVKAKSFIENAALNKQNLPSKADDHRSQTNEGDQVDPTASSSVSMSTEVTSCEDSNADTSADFSSIGKDLDFFEDTITYLKSATTLLGTMDDVFDDRNRKDAPHPTVVVHLAEDVPIESEEQDMKSNLEHEHDEMKEGQVKDHKETKEDILRQAAIVIQSAIRGYRVRKELNRYGKEPVEDTTIKREKRSLHSEAPGAEDVLRQAAVVIQSAIRGYRVRKAMNEKIKKSEADGNDQTLPAKDAEVIEIEKPKGGLETKIGKTSSPVAIIHPTMHLPHPTVVVHLAEDLPEEDNAVQEHEPKPDSELKDERPQEKDQSNSIVEEVPTAKHVKRSSTLLGGITREKHIETQPKHGMSSKETGTLIKRDEPVQRKVNIVKSMSLDDTRQAKTFTKRERKPRTVTQTSAVREKPIEINGKAVKADSFDKSVRKTQVGTEKNGKKSKPLQSKPPSTSDLLRGPRLAKNKRNQFGRSMSVSEQLPETPFDVEAIKKELLSKKGKSPPQSSRKAKISPKENRSFRTQASLAKDSKASSQSVNQKEVSKMDTNLTDMTDEKADEIKEHKIDSSDKLDSSSSTSRNSEHNSDEDLMPSLDNSKQERVPEMKSSRSESSECERTKDDKRHKDVERPPSSERPSDAAETENEKEKVEEAVLQKSATTIQKTFRGYKVRKNLASGDVEPSEVQENTVKSVPRVTEDPLDATTTSQKPGQSEDEPQRVEVPKVEKDKSSGIFDNLRREVDEFKNAVLEKSATKIQKTFRGYKTRKDLAVKDKRASTEEETEKSLPSEIAQTHTNTSRDEELSKEEGKVVQEPGAFDSFDVEEFHNAALEKSATTIQKTFRGYKTRKDLKDGKLQEEHRQDDANEEAKPSKSLETNKEPKEHQPISEEGMPSNVVLEKAAVTIQKTYKGFKTRKDLQTGDGLQQNSSKMLTKSDEDVNQKPFEESTYSLPDQTGESHDNNQNEFDNSSKSILDDLTEETLRDAKSLSPDRQDKHKSNRLDTSIKSSSASALLENAATTIQKAYRDYHTRKDHTSTQSPPIKSYSHGAKRDNTFKETFENSDESSTFIGPDTSFDLSDVESEKHVPTSTDPPTLTHDDDELDLDNPTTLAINFLSEEPEHPNDSANTMASSSLFVPQELRRKRSIIDPTAPLLEDILNADETSNNDQKPQWYVGDVLITPTDSTNISTDPQSFLKPLASSSSLSSLDARNESINSAVVSTSSLLFTNDTEMHAIDPLNTHSSAVSANEEDKQEIDRLEEKKSDEALADNQDHEKDEDLSNGSPRREDGPESIVADLCRNCADGIHDSDGHTCQEGEVTKETSSEVANVEDTKDASDSTEKHFDEIKQFVLMEESSPAKDGEIGDPNKPNGNKSVDGTDTVDIQVSNVQNGDDKGKSLVVGVEAIDNDSRACPSIALIPPSSEDDVSDRESVHETKASENGDMTANIESSDKVAYVEIDNKTTEESKESPSTEENSKNKTENIERDGKSESVHGPEGSTTVKSHEEKADEVENDPSVKVEQRSKEIESTKDGAADDGVTEMTAEDGMASQDLSESNTVITVKSDENKEDEVEKDRFVKVEQSSKEIEIPKDGATDDGVTEVTAEDIMPSQDVSESNITIKEHEGKGSGSLHAEEEQPKKPNLELLSEPQDSNKSSLDEKIAETDTEASKTEHDAVQKETQGFEDNFIENDDSKAAVEGSISVIKENELSSEKPLEKVTAQSQSSNDKPLANGDRSEKNGGNLQSPELESTHDSKDNEENVRSAMQLNTEKLHENGTPNEDQKLNNDEQPNKVEKSIEDEAPNQDQTPTEDNKTIEDDAPNKGEKSNEVETQKTEKIPNEEKKPSEDEKPIEGDSEPKSVEGMPKSETEVETSTKAVVTINEDTPEAPHQARKLSEDEIPNEQKKSSEDEKPIEGVSESKAVDDTPKSEEKTEEQTSLKALNEESSKASENVKTSKDVVSKTATSETQEDEKPSEENNKKDSNSTELHLTQSEDTGAENLKGMPLKKSSLDDEGSEEKTASGEKEQNESSSKSTEELLSPETEQMTKAESLDGSKPKVESSVLDDTTEDTGVSQEQEVPQEDLEIASKLLENKPLSEDQEVTPVSTDTKPASDDSSKLNSSSHEEGQDSTESPNKGHSPELDLEIQANVEKLIDATLLTGKADTIEKHDLPTENAPEEVIEVAIIKKIIPPTPLSATSDQDESELESTTTKADSTTTPGYDDASENDDLETPSPMPDNLESVTEKLRETEAMVARMHQRRASEHRISIETVDQPPVFEKPIKPMRELQQSTSNEVEDDIILQKLQRSDTTRESSAQSESVIFGDSTAQVTESDDTFNENLDLKALHRMNTIASERSTFKPPGVLFKSVTIDDTIKYIDPEKSTEESGGSFCMDDAMTADVRKKIMAYSVSEADSDYYEPGDHPPRPHDDFNISTALDTFPSSDTDTTIISAATKIQAGARGFLTRRRLRRASMGTKSSLTDATKASFGNEAIGESLDRLVEEEDGKRLPKVQYHRQVGVNSLPSAMGNSDGDELHPDDDSDELKLARLTATTSTTQPHGEWSSIDGQGEAHNLSTSSETDVNRGIEEGDDSTQVPSISEATLAARRLTLQRGDAMRNDSAPDDDNNGNAKQVDPAKNIPATTDSMLIHQKTMVESTKMTTTTTTTTTTERRNYSDAATTIKMEKVKWFAMRQNSMPVQIDSEVFRVLPKHMRKRIKSAEGEQKKRIRLPRD